MRKNQSSELRVVPNLRHPSCGRCRSTMENPTMTPDEIASVRNSFAMVPPIAGPAGGLFYDQLFALDPSLRRLCTATSPSRRPSSCRYWHLRWRIVERFHRAWKRRNNLSLRGTQRRSNLLPDERNSARQAGDCFGAARLAMTGFTHDENALAKPDTLLPGLRALGKRHVGYGVTPPQLPRWAPRCWRPWKPDWAAPSRRRSRPPGQPPTP